MDKKCYDCKYRGTIPGDAHSCCKHPDAKPYETLCFIVGMNALATPKSMNIKCDMHGFSSGWFFWPTNFDPAWLENCDGFTPEELNETK